MRTLTHKGYSRLYVEYAPHIKDVLCILQELDPFEFDYMPDAWVTHCQDYPHVVYTGKFSDLDMNLLTIACWRQGMPVWVFDAGHIEWPSDALKAWRNTHAEAQEMKES